MRKISMVLIAMILAIILSSCSKGEAIPLDDPQIELFHVIFEGDNYSIFERTVIDHEKAYILIAYEICQPGKTCTVGEQHKDNYRFLYKQKYYDIVEADKLNLFTCEKLIELNIIN